MLTSIDNEKKLIIVGYPDKESRIEGDTQDEMLEAEVEEINNLFESVEDYQLKFTKELTDHPEYFAKLVQSLVDETYCMFDQVDWSKQEEEEGLVGTNFES